MNSLYNTPPTYSIYVMGLVFKWLKRIGGIQGSKHEAFYVVITIICVKNYFRVDRS